MKKVFADQAWEDYTHRVEHDKKVLKRLDALIKECERHPFAGSGKPEPLKGDFKGWWSRRITVEDRLVYLVAGKGSEQRLEIAQCRFHY